MQVYARDKGKLDLAIDAVATWASSAEGAGVRLTQVNFMFPGASEENPAEQLVILAWDDEAQDWRVDS